MEVGAGTSENQTPRSRAFPDNQARSDSCTVSALAKATTEGIYKHIYEFERNNINRRKNAIQNVVTNQVILIYTRLSSNFLLSALDVLHIDVDQDGVRMSLINKAIEVCFST